MNRITGLLIAKDEAPRLPTTIKSWRPICDQLVVVDDKSSDQTRQISRYYGARVIESYMTYQEGFAGLRNQGLENIDTSHVLVFDADELPSKEIIESISIAIKLKKEDTVYRLKRRNNAFGKWLDHGRFEPDWQIRLFPSEIRYSGLVHENPVIPENYVIEDLNGIVEHYTYSSIKEYLKKMQSYAEKLSREQQPPTIRDILKIIPRNLIKHQGYRDGLVGVLMTVGDSWHDYLLRKYALKNK